MTTSHPATLAAGGCVIIGPTQTQYVDLRTRAVTVSKTNEEWKPSALSDYGIDRPK